LVLRRSCQGRLLIDIYGFKFNDFRYIRRPSSYLRPIATNSDTCPFCHIS
jgi:hypothetical protein